MSYRESVLQVYDECCREYRKYAGKWLRVGSFRVVWQLPVVMGTAHWRNTTSLCWKCATSVTGGRHHDNFI